MNTLDHTTKGMVNWSRLIIALWEPTLDQHHTGLRVAWSMGTHTGSTSHWVEARVKYGNTHRINITLGWGQVEVWEHTLDQHYTGLRAGWSMGTHWINITLGWGQVEVWEHTLDQHCTGLRAGWSMGTHTGSTSHWVEGRLKYGNTHKINITLGWGQVEVWEHTHWINITLGWGQVEVWEHTLDQHYTGLRAGWSMGTHTLDQHHTRLRAGWSMGTHTGSTLHWVEGRLKYGNTHWINITLGWGQVEVWEHTQDQHHTGLKPGWSMGTHTGSTLHWVEARLKYGNTHWINITLGWSQVEVWEHTLDQQHTGLKPGWSMGTHTGSTSHWVEGRLKYGNTHRINITLGWGQVEVWEHTHWINITLGWSQVEVGWQLWGQSPE